MKKSLSLLIAASSLLLASCAKEEIARNNGHTYLFEGCTLQSKMTVGAKDGELYPCLWSEGDRIGIVMEGTYSNLGSATIFEGVGQNKGSFRGTLPAQAGSSVRVIYPETEFCTEGTIPSEQHQSGEKVCDISAYSLAYSEPVVLEEGKAVNFSLTHAEAIIKVRYSFQGLTGTNKVTGICITCADKDISGDYEMDYRTGRMSPCSSNVRRSVSVSISKPSPAGSAVNEVWLTSIPVETPRNFILDINIDHDGMPFHTELKFKACLKAGMVNTINATGITPDMTSKGYAGMFEVNDMLFETEPVEPTELEIYNYIDTLKSSTRYSVSVEGRAVKTFNANPDGLKANPGSARSKRGDHGDEPHIAIFGSDKEVPVTVKFLSGAPSKVDVRPLSKHYAYSLSGDELTISLKAGDRISIEPDGDIDSPLFLFVNPLETKAFNAAISDPSTRVFKAGNVYDVGTLSLKDKKNIYIQGGAILKGCIFSKTEGINDITVDGCGIIDSREFHSNSAFTVYYADGVDVRNITVLNRKNWTFRLNLCSNFTVDNVKVVGVCPYNDNWDENDAIHFLGCKHGRVTRCFGYSWDDAFNIGTNFKELYGDESFDVHVEDAIAWNVHPGNSFEFGWNCAFDNHDHSYTNCYAIHSGTKGTKNMRAGLSIHMNGEKTLSNISYENIFIEDPMEHGIFLSIIHRSAQTPNVGYVNGVTLKNIQILKQAPLGSVIRGYDDKHWMDGVTVDGLYVEGRKIMGITDPEFTKDSSYPSIYYTNLTFK